MIPAATVRARLDGAPSLALDGPQLFARYAFMPNRLAYCGGDDNRALFGITLDATFCLAR